MSLYLILAYPHTCLWCKCQYKIVGFLSYKNVGKPTRLYDVLFAIAICCNYRFNLLHKCIIVILIVNSSKHWVTYNITILSTSIVVGNAIISEAYLSAFEEESIERLRYFAPWLSFEPFFRVDKSRSRELGGVGLGLALVNEIVRVHDGSIAIRPNPSGGTIIEVQFAVNRTTA